MEKDEGQILYVDSLHFVLRGRRKKSNEAEGVLIRLLRQEVDGEHPEKTCCNTYLYLKCVDLFYK